MEAEMVLPYELVGLIYSFLSIKEMIQCRVVCVLWARAFKLLPDRHWERIIEQSTGGPKPNTKKGRKTPYYFWFLKTMREYHKFMEEKRYPDAVRWAALNGHHALIRQMLKYFCFFVITRF